MANNKKVKRGFYKLLPNAQTTVKRTLKYSTTTTTTKTTAAAVENETICQVRAKYKTTSHCDMKYRKNITASNNNYRYSNNKDRSVCSKSGCTSCSRQSFALFSFSCYSPNSLITFITKTICGCVRNVNNLCWRYVQQQQQQQQQQKQKYKIKNKICNNSTTTAASFKCPTTSSLKNNNFFTSIKLHFFWWLLLSILAPCVSLTMTEVRIPKHTMRYETAALGCKYDLDGESLYSVKWYKDGFEFYRYVPRDMPPGQVFPLPGVDVDLQNSTDNVVVLNRVTLQSTGRYRCEVSGEAPSFQTVSGHEDMIVVVTPVKGPQITGGQPRYSIGEKVAVNCTSAPSKPICHLSWLINGVHANRSYLRYYEPKIVGREGLEVATLGLEFRVRG